MNITIEVLGVTIESKPNSKGGTYQIAEVAHKDLGTGKVNGKKIVSFVAPALFSALTDNSQGKKFTITMAKEPAKDGKEYWNWKTAAVFTGEAQQAPQTTTSASVGRTTTSSTYATAEERAKTQIYIVKQSAIAQAVNLLSVGAKSPPSSDAVLEQAQKFVDYVFSSEKPNNSIESLVDLPDDVPF